MSDAGKIERLVGGLSLALSAGLSVSAAVGLAMGTPGIIETSVVAIAFAVIGTGLSIRGGPDV